MVVVGRYGIPVSVASAISRCSIVVMSDTGIAKILMLRSQPGSAPAGASRACEGQRTVTGHAKQRHPAGADGDRHRRLVRSARPLCRRALHGRWAPTAADARNRGPVCVNYFLDTNAMIAVLKNQPAGVRGRLRRVVSRGLYYDWRPIEERALIRQAFEICYRRFEAVFQTPAGLPSERLFGPADVGLTLSRIVGGQWAKFDAGRGPGHANDSFSEC